LKASLTELEATGIQPSPHQSLGTGQSMELAHDEMRRVAVRGCFRRLSSWFQLSGAAQADLRSAAYPLCIRECRGHCPLGDRGSWARVIPHL